MPITRQSTAKQNLNAYGTCRAAVSVWQNIQGRLRHCTLQILATLFKAHSKDPCIFVVEKQSQGTEGRSGKKKRQMNNLKTFL